MKTLAHFLIGVVTFAAVVGAVGAYIIVSAMVNGADFTGLCG